MGERAGGSARELPLLVQRAEEGQSGPALAEHFNYEPPALRPWPPALQYLSDHIFKLFLVTVFGGSAVVLLIAHIVMDDHNDSLLGLPCQRQWKTLVKYISIPLVSVLFTWWHVWLGIKMCFYPINFVGCCKPYLGWQGIVPRRAHVMARRSCDIMIGNLITIEEIIGRVEPDDFFNSLQEVLSSTSEAVVTKLAKSHCPEIWNKLPDWCKKELQEKVLEENRTMFNPIVGEFKSNINQILDIKQMAIDVLVENKPLLVHMFQKIGGSEFEFIQHTAAVMGCMLGIVQMLLWVALNSGGDDDCHSDKGRDFRCWGGFVILPISGLLIGYFTNWLGITMIFRPVEPRIVCGGYVNIQGVFLKRQQAVAQELSTLITEHLVHAHRLLEYIVAREDVADKILHIYEKHMSQAVDQVLSQVPGGQVVIPRFVGQGAVDGIKREVVKATLAELPGHTSEIEAYMDRTFGLRDTLAYRLSRLPPDKFEGMLHPVFQEDEWMLLLLGGVLGIVVGTLQAAALGS